MLVAATCRLYPRSEQLEESVGRACYMRMQIMCGPCKVDQPGLVRLISRVGRSLPHFRRVYACQRAPTDVENERRSVFYSL
eukprot:9496511-Pyramimonas_sp.AAC.1